MKKTNNQLKLLLFSAMIVVFSGSAYSQIQPVPTANHQYTLRQPALLVAEKSSFYIAGTIGSYIENVKNNWLMKMPDNNPAMLNMFAVRDIQPYMRYMPWSGEFAGKYLTGAGLMLRLTGDTALKKYLKNFVIKLLPLQDPEDGYFGPFKYADRLSGWDTVSDNYTWEQWNHTHMMLGLLLWYENDQDKAVLNAVKRIGDMMCHKFGQTNMLNSTYRYSTDMNQALLYGMTLLYKKTGEKKYLQLAEKIVKEFEYFDRDNVQAGDYVTTAMQGKEFFETPRPRWESIYALLGLAELYYLTGNNDYKKTLTHFWWSITKTDRHNNGGFSSAEGAVGNPYATEAIETCCTVAWVAMSVEMLKMTGNSIVADELELSTLNQVMGYQSPDGLWCTYNTPMDGKRLPGVVAEIDWQSRPGSEEISCCSANAPSGFGYLSEWALMQNNKGLVLNWYGPSNLKASLGHNEIAIKQDTDYPRSGLIKLIVEPTKAQTFDLQLRIPYWSAHTTVYINGRAAASPQPGSYLSLKRNWRKGDIVELGLDMSLRYWKGDRHYVGKSSIYRGPLLLVAEDQYISPTLNKAGDWKAEGLLFASDKVQAFTSATFNGTNISWEAEKSDSCGIVGVEIDGKIVEKVDLFALKKNTSFEWSKSDLTDGTHQIRLIIQPEKNDASPGHKFKFFRFGMALKAPKTEKYMQGDSFESYRQSKVQLNAVTLNQEAILRPVNQEYPSQVVLEIKQNGHMLVLQDYGTAGMNRKRYTSWLNVQDVKPAAFSAKNPGRSWRP